MPRIYFERQVAAMCGQHMLNNLLQGRYFDAGALADFAGQLDQEERQLGLQVDAMRNGSQNVDASGNFSIQVLERALERRFNVGLVRDEEEVKKALRIINDAREPDSTLDQIAFVLNQQNHWYAARWLHREFWVVNSLNDQPEPISRFELSNYVQDMRNQGWSVFVTKGRLPPLSQFDGSNDWYSYGADAIRNDDNKKPKVAAFQGQGHSLKTSVTVDANEDPELALAIQMSMVEYDAGSPESGPTKLEEEPSKDAKATTLQLVLPGAGKKVRRRFNPELTADQVYAWAKTFPEVQSGKLQSIQKVDDRTDVKRTTLLEDLGNGCSLRVVMY